MVRLEASGKIIPAEELAIEMLPKTVRAWSGVEVAMPSLDSMTRLPVPVGEPVGQAPPEHIKRFSSNNLRSPPVADNLKSPAESR